MSKAINGSTTKEDTIMAENVIDVEVKNEVTAPSLEDGMNEVMSPNTQGEYETLELMARSYATYDLVIPDDLEVTTAKERTEVRNTRSEINAIVKQNDRARIDMRKKILEEYDRYIEVYRDKVEPLLLERIEIADKAVAKYEADTIEKLDKEVRAYYEEITKGTAIENLDTVSFDTIGLSITFSKTLSSLKRDVKTFVDKVNTDLTSIQMMNNGDRVLEYYKESLDMADSVAKVQRDIEVAEEMARKMAEEAIEKERRALELQNEKERERIRAEERERLRQQAAQLQQQEPAPAPTVAPEPVVEEKHEAPAAEHTGNYMKCYNVEVVATPENFERVMKLLQQEAATTRVLGSRTATLEDL